MLILTVWVVTLLSLLAVGLGSKGVFALGVTDRLEEQMRTRTVASSGVQFALALLAQDPTPETDGPAEGWASLKDWELYREPEIKVDVGSGLVDEDRRINLNTAPVEVLQSLFRAAGVRKEDALGLAEVVADWRDEDDKERKHGAEGFDYEGFSPGYECKDGPFESVEELLLVKGMTPALWATCAPTLTVYGSGKVNLNTAGAAVLSALGLSTEGVNGIVAYRSGEDNTPGTSDDRLFYSTASLASDLSNWIPIEDQNRLTQLDQAKFLGIKSDAFALSVKAEGYTSKSRIQLTCVIDRSDEIKAWTEM